VTAAGGLLEGLKVVEVALLAPNQVGMHLADLGADVVKVEEPGRGDYTREVGAVRIEGASLLHWRWNRGKRSITLDLRSEEGAETFRDLARWADVVVEGMRPGALARRGLGYDDLRPLNPRLVFCSVSGWGQTGPYRDLATHGVAYDAYAGLAPPERTPEGFASIPSSYVEVGTLAGGLYGALGVVAAVLRARETGEGCWLDVAQADAAVAFNASHIEPVLNGVAKRGGRGGAGLSQSVRYQYYECADGRFVLFQASERHFWERFCIANGRENLLEGRTGADVGEHARGDVELRRELTALFLTRTQGEWVRFFLDHDVPGGPVHAGGDVVDDPQFVARTPVIEHGPVRLVGPVIAPAAPTRRPAPAPGEHTDEVLGTLRADR
jgi:crotonobetainyl-CoA:carnitine CoA-transferase CaiB-like acyl-CoA transferase